MKEKTASAHVVADAWLNKDPQIMNVIVEEMRRKLVENMADILANGGEYIFRMGKPYPAWKDGMFQTTTYKTSMFYEPLVRCKDCKYAHLTLSGECKYCDMWKDEDDDYVELYLDGDYYCASGERKVAELKIGMEE